jgi:hypothetical protein
MTAPATQRASFAERQRERQEAAQRRQQAHRERAANSRARLLEKYGVRAGRIVSTQPGCRSDTHRCFNTRNPKVKTSPCCIRWNVMLLRKVTESLNGAGIPWWIDYGTLLGHCVNGGFYWNDKDTDINCLAEDRDRVRALLEKPLKAEGLNVYYIPPGRSRFKWGDVLKVRLSKLNHNNCDITFWERAADGLLDRKSWSPSDNFKGREMPESWVFPTTRATWEGVEVNVPAEPEKLIAYRYGDHWQRLDPIKHDKARHKGFRELQKAG